MTVVKIKAKPDRVARVSPRGSFIPSDRFIPVEETPYIRRLINVHKDVIVEPKKPVVTAAPKPETKGTK